MLRHTRISKHRPKKRQKKYHRDHLDLAVKEKANKITYAFNSRLA